LRERREAKVGARLVRTDLALAASHLKNAEDDGKWWPFYRLSMGAWSSYRSALAAVLNE
jgi:hypothetical protein